MSTEFSLEGLTALCALKWSTPRLARNLNWYRKAVPTDAFWDVYEGPDKDEEAMEKHKNKMRKYFKDNGVTLYKEYDEWGLFDWTRKDKGTEEEYEKQEEEKEEKLCELLRNELLGAVSKEDEYDFKKAKKEIALCDTVAELEDFARYEVVYGIAVCNRVKHSFSLL